jgi:hypothetical protein
MNLFKLPPFTVTLWFRVNEEMATLKTELIEAAEAFPYQNFEYQGMQDMHWGAETETEAKEILERLKPFTSNANVVVLKLSGRHENFRPIMCKDERHGKRKRKTPRKYHA